MYRKYARGMSLFEVLMVVGFTALLLLLLYTVLNYSMKTNRKLADYESVANMGSSVIAHKFFRNLRYSAPSSVTVFPIDPQNPKLGTKTLCFITHTPNKKGVIKPAGVFTIADLGFRTEGYIYPVAYYKQATNDANAADYAWTSVVIYYYDQDGNLGKSGMNVVPSGKKNVLYEIRLELSQPITNVQKLPVDSGFSEIDKILIGKQGYTISSVLNNLVYFKVSMVNYPVIDMNLKFALDKVVERPDPQGQHKTNTFDMNFSILPRN